VRALLVAVAPRAPAPAARSVCGRRGEGRSDGRRRRCPRATRT